jgi:hypothetical protein
MPDVTGEFYGELWDQVAGVSPQHKSLDEQAV